MTSAPINIVQGDTRILHLAFELSNNTWKLAFSDGARRRRKNINARDLEQLDVEIEKARNKFKLPEKVKIVSCYEAGRDGFWLHRYLAESGIENIVVDAASIEVNRQARRAKTDSIDVDGLLDRLLRHTGGERKVWSVVTVPSEEAEDARRLHRELQRLKKERSAHYSRIKSLLILHGISVAKWSGFAALVNEVRTWDGKKLPSDLKTELLREHERLLLVEDQIKSIEATRKQRVKDAEQPAHRMVADLMQLTGIGLHSAWVFVMEFFAWRSFKNRKQVGRLAGLTPTPYDSGNSSREQGISKAGNRRVRTLIVEISWLWLRYQPQSKLSKWFQERFGHGGKRMRRIGIVAVARKLLVALWRLFQFGVIPEGAILKPTR